MWAIPNGGFRNIATAVRLKKEGVLPGIPDLFLSVPRGSYSGMFIEMKTKTGRLNPNQVEFIKDHQDDYYIVVVRDLDNFLKEVTNYLTL